MVESVPTQTLARMILATHHERNRVMPEVIALITVASLLFSGIAVACLQYLLVRRGHEQLRSRTAVGTFVFIASFLAGLGLAATYVLDRSTYPWAGAVGLMISALGLAIFVVPLHRRGQRVGFLAMAVVVFTFGTAFFMIGRALPTDTPILYLVAALALMVVGTLHQGSVIETKMRQAGKFVASSVSFDAHRMRLSRFLLAIACGVLLVADSTGLLFPRASLLQAGMVSVGILCAGASFACFLMQYARPWLA